MKGKSESEVAQLSPTLRDPMDCSLPGSSINGIFQARVLEWVAIAFSDRGNLPQHNKGHIKETHSKHHSQQWKTETISAMISNKTSMSTLATFIQHNFGSPSHGNQRRKRNKRNPNWKRSKIHSFQTTWYYTQKILKMLPENHSSSSVNLVNWEDTRLINRNIWHPHTLITKDLKEKSRKQSHLSSHQKE